MSVVQRLNQVQKEYIKTDCRDARNNLRILNISQKTIPAVIYM